MLKSLPKFLAFSAVLVWFGFIGLSVQYDAARPTTPNTAEGRVYPLNNHGHVVYLTAREEKRLNSLEMGAIGLFILAALMDYFQRAPRTIGEILAAFTRTLSTASQPGNWPVFVARIRRQLAASNIRRMAGVLAGRKRISLYSERPIPDCRTRLGRSIGGTILGPVRLLGDIRGNKFHLYVEKRDSWNSFSPNFYGKLTDASPGTAVEGKFQMHFIIRIFLIIWFTGIAMIGGGIMVESIKSVATVRSTTDTYIAFFSPGLLFLCGLLIVYWGKMRGEDDEAQVVTFLQNTLDSRPLRTTGR